MKSLVLFVLFLFSTNAYAGDFGVPIPFPTVDISTPIPFPPVEKTTYRISDSCCKVDCGGLYASGTAISGDSKGKTFILTAKHVAEVSNFKVWCCDKEYQGRYLGRHFHCDVAILEVDAELPTLDLADREPGKDTEFFIKACGVDFDFNTPRTGKVSYYGQWEGGGTSGRAMYVNVKAGPGDSGGGLIDNNGKVIGLVSGAGKNADCAAQCVDSIKEVLKAIDDFRNKKSATIKPSPILLQNQFPMQLQNCVGGS